MGFYNREGRKKRSLQATLRLIKDFGETHGCIGAEIWDTEGNSSLPGPRISSMYFNCLIQKTYP